MFDKIKDRVVPKVATSRGRRARKEEKDKLREEIARRATEKAKQELGNPAGEQLGREDGVSSPLPIQSNQAQPWQDPTEVVPERDAASLGSATQEATVYPYQSTRSSNISPSPLERQPTIDVDDADVSTNVAGKSESSPISILNRPRPVEPGPIFVGDVRAKMAAGTLPLRPDGSDQQEELSNRSLVRSKATSRRPLPSTTANGERKSAYMHGNSSPAQSRLSNSQYFASDSFRSRSGVDFRVEGYVNPQIGAGHDDPSEEDEKERDQRPESDNEASPRASWEQTKNLQQGEQPGDEDDKISSGFENSAAEKIKTLKEQLDRYKDRIKELGLEKAKLEGRWEERLEAKTQALEEKLVEERSQHDDEAKEMQADFLRERGKYEKKLQEKKQEYEEDLKAKEEMLATADTRLKAANFAKESKTRDIEKLKERQAVEIRKATEALEKTIRLKDEALKKMEADKNKELRDEQKKYEQALEKQKDTATKELATAKATLQKVITEKEAEIDKLKRERQAELEAEKEKSRNQLAIAKIALDKLRAAKEEKINTMREEHNYALYLEQQKFGKLQTDTELRVTKLREAYSTEKETLRQQHVKDQQLAVSGWQQEVQRLETALEQITLQKDEKIEEINYAHQQEIQRWEVEVGRVSAQKDKKIEEIKLAHQQEVEGLKAEVRQVTLRKNKEIKDINHAHENSVVKLKNDLLEEKANAIRQLTADNERLLRFSIKKEVFKAMTDTDLEERFGAICREVDGLARVDWNELRKSNWPVPERAIQQAKIPRVAKQHLIQNTLWAILYDRVFCTPFRVLGSEGRALDQDWAQEFGQGGNSAPKATKKAEKWRYDNMVKCVEAVRSPTLDNQYIKDGYNSTVRDVTDKLFAELQQVATIDDMKRHDIDKIRVNEMMKMAAQFWLDIGLQRFRTKVIVSETGQPAILSRQSNAGPNGNLKIVVLPELRRLGNAQGDQLEQEEIVMAGDFKVFRVR